MPLLSDSWIFWTSKANRFWSNIITSLEVWNAVDPKSENKQAELAMSLEGLINHRVWTVKSASPVLQKQALKIKILLYITSIILNFKTAHYLTNWFLIMVIRFLIVVPAGHHIFAGLAVVISSNLLKLYI
jgi:hypothetical protein